MSLWRRGGNLLLAGKGVKEDWVQEGCWGHVQGGRARLGAWVTEGGACWLSASPFQVPPWSARPPPCTGSMPGHSGLCPGVLLPCLQQNCHHLCLVSYHILPLPLPHTGCWRQGQRSSRAQSLGSPSNDYIPGPCVTP